MKILNDERVLGTTGMVAMASLGLYVGWALASPLAPGAVVGTGGTAAAVDSAGVASAINWNTIILAIITALGTAFGGWITYRTNTIHTAVNSERAAMTKALQEHNDTIALLAAHLAAVTGNTAIGDLAQQIAQDKTPRAPGVVPAPQGKP